MRPNRIVLLRAALLVLAFVPATAGAFGFEDVAKRARDLAGKAYKAPESKLPAELRNLNYDQHRSIRFRPEQSLWRGTGLPFEVQFFHPGWLFQRPVAINLVTGQGVKPYRFNPEAFDYGELRFDRKALQKLGYAGFRIHYPINKTDYKDEIAVFLGATYFRAVGRKQSYGLSARGLAVDTGLPSGEEFPTFREFWIEWPSPDAREIVVYALLDSRRVTGAYRFVIRPGTSTTMDVRMRVFLRAPVGRLGIAPLTSMYFFGENQPAPHEEYRPEVHDSDGLLIAASTGEWLWRPLVNPRRLLITPFLQENPRGFGLMQRDRLFQHYEDLEARYERRPSAWVEPQGEWGKGSIELVQIPTADEFNDNIVTYWVPETAPAPGKPLDLSYRLHWQLDNETEPPVARVAQTRRGSLNDKRTLFLVDFTGGDVPPGTSLDPVVWASENAEVLEQRAYPNEAAGGWRMAITVRRKDPDEPVEMRAFLRGPDGGGRSETWSYIWPAP